MINKELIEQAQAIVTKLETETDRLFIQEIINDMYRNGHTGSKAHYMLEDWSRELRNKSHMRGKTKKTFYKQVGKENW